MKKLSTVASLVLILGCGIAVGFVPMSVHAEVDPATGLPLDPTPGYAAGTSAPDPTPASTPPATSAPASAPPGSASGGGGSGTSGSVIPTPPLGTPGELQGHFWAYFVQLFAWMFGVALILLDQVVLFTVAKMGAYIKNLTSVGVAWRIFRDLGNIALIFGFLAGGLMTILQVDAYGYGRKMLPKLLLVAVFLNFSLFFAEAIIDINNYLSLQVYNQISGGTGAGVKTLGVSEINQEPLANAIMTNIGLQRIYGSAISGSALSIFEKNPMTVGVLSIFLFLIASFVIMTLALILLMRFVILLYHIIVSPIGFVSLALPRMDSFGKKWWSGLVEQAITAPVLLLLLYVALRIITDASFFSGIGCTGSATCAPDFFGVFSGESNGWAATIISYVIAMGLLLTVSLTAKKISAFGADTAVKWAGRATFGAAAYTGSAVFGGLARGGREFVQRKTPNNRFTRGLSGALRRVETSTMDVRAMPVLGTGIQSGLKFAGAGEAASPVAKSIVDRTRQLNEWRKKTEKDSTKQYEAETRIKRIKDALALGTPAALQDASKIMRTVTDDELGSDAMTQLLKTNANAVSALTPAQAAKLSDETLLDPAVHMSMSSAQLESIRRAGMLANVNAQRIGANLLGHAAFIAYIGVQSNGTQRDIKDFWRMP